jgi:hypothetical protein
MQMNDDPVIYEPEIIESDDDDEISDMNDVWESIWKYAPRCAWLAFNDNHEISERKEDTCFRPDLCLSYYLNIPFERLREITEPHD